MAHYWWQDLLDRNSTWQGLELRVQETQNSVQAMEMLTGHHGRMTLQLNGEPLFWATVLEDHSGVWLVHNAEHGSQRPMLPPVTAADMALIQSKSPQVWTQEWCRYFARHLLERPVPLLSAGRWLLRPMLPVERKAPRICSQLEPLESWHFSSPASAGNIGCSWLLYGEDFPDLTRPAQVCLVDWWWGGNLLLGRYAIDIEAGRLKWWRKKCREGTLPPVLVWYIAGLASFVILDGHYRLQAAIDEGIPPQFLVLSELDEQLYEPDLQHRARVAQALEQQLRKNPQCSIDSVNQALIDLYDTRYLYASTHSRAVLGDGETWAREVSAYLRRHQLEGYLEKILDRQGDDSMQ